MGEEFKITEYKLAIEMYKSHINITIQATTAMLIASITIIGFAFEEKESWIFLLGGFLALAMFILVRRSEKASRFILIRAFELENELAESKFSIAKGWVFRIYGENGYVKIESSIKHNKGLGRFEEVQKLNTNRGYTMSINLILLYSFLLFLASIVLYLYGWDFY